jgi:RHS repeat-associated protein
MFTKSCVCVTLTVSNKLLGMGARYFGLAILVLAWLLGPSCTPLKAQDTFLEDIGIQPFTTSIPVENGFIDAATGRLHLEIPLANVPERAGGRFKTALVYESNIWGLWYFQNVRVMDPGTNGAGAPSITGWQLVTSADSGSIALNSDVDGGWCGNSQDYNYETYGLPGGWTWTSPDGASHTFHASTKQYWATYCNQYNPPIGIPNATSTASDASGYYLSVTNYLTTTVYAPDGTQVYPQVKDSNGNFYMTANQYIRWSDTIPGNPNSPTYSYLSYARTFTDSVGRAVATVSQNADNASIAVLNSQGTTSQYTVVTGLVKLCSHWAGTGGLYLNWAYDSGSGSFRVVKEVDLPDGTKYSFAYDSDTRGTDCAAGIWHYGNLASMTMPTGAQITYSFANYTNGSTSTERWIHTRTTPDSATPWTYTPSWDPTTCPAGGAPFDINNCQQYFTVAKPNGDTNVYTFNIVYNGVGSDLASGAFPTKVQYYNGAALSANLLATNTQTWDSTWRKVTLATTTLPVPGGTTISQTIQDSWDFTYGNLTRRSAWNFGNPTTGPADRTIAYTYLNTSGYLTANVVNRPLTVTVTNASSSTVSQTVNCYDYAGGCGGTSFASATNKTNHDDTLYPATNTIRGDLTQVKKLISGSTYLTTSMTYDMRGQVITSIDSNLNQTSYDYTDNFYNDPGDGSDPVLHTVSPATNAYVKTITHPTVNSVTLIDTFGYYWGTGQKALSTDPNGKTTYFHFYDSLNRPTSTKLPNSYNGTCCGWTYAVYPYSSETQVDNGIGITSTTRSISCTGTSGGCRHDKTLSDNLGRVTSAILVSDPDTGGQTTVNTAYDSNGRVYSVSNPHRSGSNPTDGTEFYAYDGLDRKIQVTRPDGSIVHTYYGAAVSTNGGRSSQVCSGYGVGYPILYKDEAAKLRQTWTDGFGRLIEVDEPDPLTGSLTTGSYASTCYSYDLNNNLTGVTQGSQTRTFSYDMLSRLMVATNPESGTINYYYTTSGGSLCSGDPSAVCRRTDARSITTTYAYDALNRLISKSYSDSTPQVKYGYDAVAPSGCTPPTLAITNGKGRRTSMCDGPGQTAWSYDEVGNALIEKRTTNSATDSFSYTYNLDSMVATVVYPSGRTITYQPGGAQRPLSGKDIANSINYAASATYAPFGGITSLQNGANLVSTVFYNSRSQPCRISIKNSGTAPSSCTDGSYTGSVMDMTYNFSSGTSDNGNVVGITNKIDSTRSQAFTYDSLNRIATAAASTYATSPSHCWGESFTLDRYGNLTGIGSISSAYNGCTQDNLNITASSTSNRITTSGFTYDASGNLTSDGTHSPSYDAEGHTTSIAGVTYYYDGDGKRVRKSSGTLYWYGTNSDPLLETDGGGSLTKEYIFFGGKRIASRDSSSNVSYYFADHLGTARVVTNASGTVQDDSDFYPYGGERVVSSGSGNHYKFTGKERDSESGLDNFGARYYSSQYGRFMSPDPSNLSVDFWLPQTWNRYSYVLNNPLQMVDRNGQWPTSIHKEIINEAFPGMSPEDLKTLSGASHNMDYGPGQQDPAQSYEHGMSDGPAGQTSSQAEQQADAFIAQNEHEAQQIQADWVASGHAGIAPAALTAFGNALHTITDRLSPAHAGYQPWYGQGWWNPSAWLHYWREHAIHSSQMDAATSAARSAFLRTFGDNFDWMLDSKLEVVTHEIGPPTKICGYDDVDKCGE